MLAAADFHVELVVTRSAGHASSYVRSADLSLFDFVVVMSGDGMLHEIINALAHNQGAASFICSHPPLSSLLLSSSSPSSSPASSLLSSSSSSSSLSRVDMVVGSLSHTFSHVSLVLLPCGTSNGFAISTSLWTPSISTLRSLFHVTKLLIEQGKPSPVDVMSLEMIPASSSTSSTTTSSHSCSTSSSLLSPYSSSSSSSSSSFSSLSSSGDVVMEMMAMSLSFVSDIDRLNEREFRRLPGKTVLIPLYFIAVKKSYPLRLQFLPAPLPSSLPMFGPPSSSSSSSCLSPKQLYNDHTHLAESPERTGWRLIEDEVVFFSVCNVRAIAPEGHFCPGVHHNDGSCDIILIRTRNCSRLQLLYLTLMMATANHVLHPAVEIYKCSELIVSPANHIDLSGELYAPSRIHVRIHRGLVNMLLPPLNDNAFHW